ncbi:M1 family aminopeptidase [Leucobacter iarius]|uniref:Aminopeptidase N n=1 Tax=Leucobacter iarius TaxID=333963 RepID=A0ABN2LQ48_9MICO
MKLTIPTRARRTALAGVAAAALAALAVSSPIGLPAAQADAAPIDGAPSIGDSLFAGIGNGGYDVKHYDVKLRYQLDNTISATTTITATAAVPLKTFTLDFEGLNIDSVKVNGADASYARSSDPSRTSYKLQISPQGPLPAGDFTVAIAYSGTPSTHTDPDGSKEGWVKTADGATALGQPVGTMAWIPSNNTPADKATYDFAFTIPTQIGGVDAAAVSNGELVSKTPVNGGAETTWTWKQERPMSTMATMVSIGKYLSYESQVTLDSGRTIPEWSFVDPTVTAPRQATIQTLRAKIPAILNFLESKYGPYPGGSTGVVVDVTTLGYALETQDRPYFERGINESTLVHELAHQWFGDAISPADWNSIWLSEGMASYSEYMWDEHNGGDSTLDSTFAEWNRIAAGNAFWQIPPGAMEDPADLFGDQVYNRGSMTYEALKQTITPPVFAELLKQWNARNTGTSKTTEDFHALAEEVSGKDLDAFFQDWIFDADKPAWPSTWSLALTSDPAAGQIAAGDSVTYTLTAKNTGKVALAGRSVTVDVAALLKRGTIDEAALPAGLVLSGTTLTWTVPETAAGADATVEFTGKLKTSAHGVSIPVTAKSDSLGFTCTACTVTHTTQALPKLTEADLTDENRGGIEAPATAKQGETITVQLGTGDYNAEPVTGTLFSDPTDLGSPTVSDGSIELTIPADAEVRAHKLAITSDTGVLIGWAPIEVQKAGDSAATAGSDGTSAAGGSNTGANGSSTADGAGANASAGSNANANGTSGADGTGLPTTGGAALTPILIAGGAVILLGAIVLAFAAARRRKNAGSDAGEADAEENGPGVEKSGDLS